MKTGAGRRIAMLLQALFLGSLVAGTGAANAQGFPNHPIRLVVPYPPGGGTDFFARAVGTKMSDILGQQIIVENRPGASGIIAGELVAKSAPDGYTMLLGDNATYALNVSLYKKLPYDPVTDFQPVTLTARFALLLVVNPAFEPKTLKEFIATANATPGGLNYATPGPGTPHHLAMELLRQAAKANLVAVAYKGGAPAMQDVIADRIHTMFLDLVTAAPQIKAGKLRVIATGTAQRNPNLQDIPTVAEAGVPGYEASAWQGFAVPAGTPRDVVNKLNETYRKAVSDPDLGKKLRDLGTDVTPSTPEEMAAHVKSEIAKWAAAIKAGNIALD